MFDKVEKLFQTVTGADKSEIALYHNAVIETMAELRKGYSKPKQESYDSAKKALQQCVDLLWPRYFPAEAAAAAEPQLFEVQKDALGWLQSKGYKVSAGKFSGDWNSGKVKVQQGRVTLSALMEYATTLDVDRKKVANAEQRSAKKDELEIRLLEEKLRRAELENHKDDARWQLRQDAEEHEAALVGILRDTFRHRVYLDHGLLLQTAGGDPARESEFAAALQDFIDAAFNEVADGRQFEVEFEDDQEGEY